MTWRGSRPGGSEANAKYETPEYRAERARLHAELRANGSGRCAEVVCVMRSRLITPGMRLHVCHDATGTRVLGLGHAQCNLSDAGRRARARQVTTARPM